MRSRALSVLLVVAFLFLPALGVVSHAQSADDVFIQGTVTNEQGGAIEGVNITARNTTTAERFSALSDENGTYNITLPAGMYNISTDLPNYSANITYNNVLVEEGLMNLNFTMREVLGKLTGYVTNGTVPITAATVHLTSEQYNYSTNSTVPLGAYTINNIRPGTYVAYAEKDGYWTSYHQRAITIERGDEIQVNFTLEEQPATISGKVTYGSDGLEGVKVTIASSGFSTFTYTDNEGNYTLSSIPLGTYTITFSKNDFVEEEMQVSLSPFETKKLDVSMEKEVTEDEGFIPGFDLPHSLMIVGMILSLITLVLALGIRYRIGKKPGLLLEEGEE